MLIKDIITHDNTQFKIERLEPGDEEYADMKVSVLDDWGNEAGFAKFASDGKDLDPRALKVHDRYRGQGFAKLIYDFMKSKGYRIIRSWDQTDDGAHFWDKNRGEDVRVWENFADGKHPGRKGLAKRVGVNCKQPVSKLRSIAAHSTGEKQRMAHWCANMKSGKKK
jgi:GNAT superfamily N-acetyltransferase